MRTLRLAQLATQAEILLIRRHATAVFRRIAYGLVAAVFGLGVLILLHVLGGIALVQFAHLAPFYAVMIVGSVDLFFMLIFLLLASGKMPDPMIEEARLMRDQSLEQMRESLTLVSLIRPASRVLGRKGLTGLIGAALAAQFLGRKAK